VRRLLGIGLLALAACSPERESEYVYVPADGYVISVQIVVPAEARAGEWVPLSAERRSGPWKRVRRAEAPPGFVPFGRPPPEYEAEVADNLDWLTDPPDARFDLPPLDGHKRKVRFDRPGTYQIWARNAYPTDAKSNVATVTVRK
jgi:hypothetical protein